MDIREWKEIQKTLYHKFPKYSDTQKKNVVITLKVEQDGFSLE